VTANIIIVSY